MSEHRPSSSPADPSILVIEDDEDISLTLADQKTWPSGLTQFPNELSFFIYFFLFFI
jgi:hypothetical protein